MPSEKVMLDADDVTVVALKQPACELCESRAPTHEVRLDLRAIGLTIQVTSACKPCAKTYAASIKASLPKPPKTRRRKDEKR